MSDELLREFPPIRWEDGYPLDEDLAELQAVYRMAFGRDEAARYLRQELTKAAENCVASYEEEPSADILDRPCLRLHFSTGGWSGAEDLMAELLRKFWIAHLHVQWNRGGHYIFEAPCEPHTPEEAGRSAR